MNRTELYRAFLQQSEKEPVLFPDRSILSEDYFIKEAFYRSLFGRWLIGNTGLDRLDRRLEEYGMIPATGSDRDYYQAADLMGLKYLFIRSVARIDRLDEAQLSLLTKAMEGDEEAEADCLEMLIPDSYKVVMSVEPDCPAQWFEIKPTIHGEYRVQGADFLLCLRSLPDIIDEELVSYEEEEERLNVLKSIRPQLEKILCDKLDMPVMIFIEAFPL